MRCIRVRGSGSLRSGIPSDQALGAESECSPMSASVKPSTFARLCSSALALVVWVGCNAQGPCEKHYDTRAEQQACVVGAEVEGFDLAHHGGTALSETPLGRACSERCGSRYNDSRIPVSDDPSYFEATAEMTRMMAACREACRVAVGYFRAAQSSASSDVGCEQVRGPGGITRCY